MKYALRIIVKLRVLSHVLSWLTPGQIYESQERTLRIIKLMKWLRARELEEGAESLDVLSE